MEIRVNTPETAPPVERSHVLTMVIKSFKGRRDVDVHLFRTDWDESEKGSIPWENVLERKGDKEELDKSKRFLMEAFTASERDRLIEYLKSHYSERLSSLTATPLVFPIPSGITPLSEVALGEDIGVIRFEKIPHFDLPFTVHGLFDLSRHKPMVDMIGDA
ncbi:MAG: hypothetical protein ACLFQR_02040 [Desulfovibrionales bacterium]